MKLPLTIEIPGASQDELKALDGKLPQVGKLSLKATKDSLLFWKRKGFEIVGAEMPDSVNQKADYWPLDELTRRSLGELLVAFGKVCPRIYTLYSSPAGELPRRESDIQRAELLEMIAEGQIGHRVLYRVRELPPKIQEEAPVSE